MRRERASPERHVGFGRAPAAAPPARARYARERQPRCRSRHLTTARLPHSGGSDPSCRPAPNPVLLSGLPVVIQRLRQWADLTQVPTHQAAAALADANVLTDWMRGESGPVCFVSRPQMHGFQRDGSRPHLFQPSCWFLVAKDAGSEVAVDTSPWWGWLLAVRESHRHSSREAHCDSLPAVRGLRVPSIPSRGGTNGGYQSLAGKMGACRHHDGGQPIAAAAGTRTAPRHRTPRWSTAGPRRSTPPCPWRTSSTPSGRAGRGRPLACRGRLPVQRHGVCRAPPSAGHGRRLPARARQPGDGRTAAGPDGRRGRRSVGCAVDGRGASSPPSG